MESNDIMIVMSHQLINSGIKTKTVLLPMPNIVSVFRHPSNYILPLSIIHQHNRKYLPYLYVQP